jgi:hypothetical protein
MARLARVCRDRISSSDCALSVAVREQNFPEVSRALWASISGPRFIALFPLEALHWKHQEIHRRPEVPEYAERSPGAYNHREAKSRLIPALTDADFSLTTLNPRAQNP